jgi:hypothetical protein
MEIKTIGKIAIVLGILLFIHQYMLHGTFIDWEDINNHETTALALLGFEQVF